MSYSAEQTEAGVVEMSSGLTHGFKQFRRPGIRKTVSKHCKKNPAIEEYLLNIFKLRFVSKGILEINKIFYFDLYVRVSRCPFVWDCTTFMLLSSIQLTEMVLHIITNSVQ